MCRLIAIPPLTSYDEALDILLNMQKQNTDGTGFVHVKNGEFVVEKWAKSLSELLKNNISLLSHLPHDGWTLGHLRAASHGYICEKNTHPFIVDNWAIVHNGVWRDYNIVKLALKKFVKFRGDTDSEVAANFFRLLGPEQFAKNVNYGGVFLSLNRNGNLWAIKTSGTLVLHRKENHSALIASELDREKYSEQVDADEGWYLFDKRGKFIRRKIKTYRGLKYTKEEWYKRSQDLSKGWREYYQKKAFYSEGGVCSIYGSLDYD